MKRLPQYCLGAVIPTLIIHGIAWLSGWEYHRSPEAAILVIISLPFTGIAFMAISDGVFDRRND